MSNLLDEYYGGPALPVAPQSFAGQAPPAPPPGAAPPSAVAPRPSNAPVVAPAPQPDTTRPIDKSTGTKVGWAIALALGAFSQAKAAANGINLQNGAMQMFDRALQQDAMVKQRQLSIQRGQIHGARNTLAEMRDLFKDEQLALKADYLNGWTAIEKRVEANLAKYGSQEAKAAGDLLLGQIREKKA